MNGTSRIILKKELSDTIIKNIDRPEGDREDFKVYYLIDGDIYIHTRFYVDVKTMSLTVIHDLSVIETKMIKDLKAKGKMYVDENGKPYFDVYHLCLWFFFNIPSKDYVDLFGFMRVIMEIEKMDKYTNVDESEEANIN